MNKIIVITGERGAGKSQYCMGLLSRAKTNGVKVGGFIAPAIYKNGSKVAFLTQDVQTGEQRLCGSRVESGGTIGCWKMNPEILTWGNELLRKACPCDILFIDELGPLEFNKKNGYTAAFEVLRSGSFEIAYVVIRPTCLDAFRELFPDFDIILIGEEECTIGPKI